MQVDLKQIKKVYFLGIGGIGISAIARMFLLEGKEVFGSDVAESLVTEELRKAGAEVTIGQDIKLIQKDTELVVYTIAVPHFHPDFFDGVKNKFPVLSYPEVLEIISKEKYTIAVSGTHGKTTTTAMIAKILIDAGFDPTVIVGSMMKPSKSNFIAGKSKYLVVEACEYKKSFMYIHPSIAVVTNIEADHLDFYNDIDEIEKSFQAFSTRAEVIVSDFSDERLKSILDNKKAQVLNSFPYFNEALEVGVPGRHNRANASLALAVADFLGVSKELALESIKNFSGTWRRFDYKGALNGGALVYDDYAHHPSEIKATLQAMKEKYPDKKVVAIFQPHLFSRTKDLFAEFAVELSRADTVILLPIYKAREYDDGSVSSRMLAEEIHKVNNNVLCFDSFEGVKEELYKNTNGQDIVLIMGAGDISELPEFLLK